MEARRGRLHGHDVAGTGSVVTAPDGAESTVDDLAGLVAFADAVVHRVWTGRKITPSA